MVKKPVWEHDEEEAAMEADFCTAVMQGMLVHAKVSEASGQQGTTTAQLANIKVCSTRNRTWRICLTTVAPFVSPATAKCSG
jgi:hypothetical protein